MTSAMVIARLTFNEARRSRILLAAVLLSIVFLFIYGLGVNFIAKEIRESVDSGFGPGVIQNNEIFNFMTMAGLYVVNFLTIMMTEIGRASCRERV